MTSVIAFAWALEPSAESLPVGQARLDASALLPGCSLALVGSEPHAAKLRVARAASATSPVACDPTRRRPTRALTSRLVGPAAKLGAGTFCFVMRVLRRPGARPPWRTAAPRCAPGLARKVRHARPSDAPKVTGPRVVTAL